MMPAVNSEPVKSASPPKRGVYLLPNLLTTGCLFSGFYSIVAAIDRNFAVAGGAVFIALLFDGIDGRVARWTKTESTFGKEFDSLADMVAFGLAPAVLVYQWGVIRIGEYGHEWRQFGWIIAFFYVLCAALRLARFNVVTATSDKRYFQGLASPSAAATVASFVWFFSKWLRSFWLMRWRPGPEEVGDWKGLTIGRPEPAYRSATKAIYAHVQLQQFLDARSVSSGDIGNTVVQGHR